MFLEPVVFPGLLRPGRPPPPVPRAFPGPAQGPPVPMLMNIDCPTSRCSARSSISPPSKRSSPGRTSAWSTTACTGSPATPPGVSSSTSSAPRFPTGPVTVWRFIATRTPAGRRLAGGSTRSVAAVRPRQPRPPRGCQPAPPPSWGSGPPGPARPARARASERGPPAPPGQPAGAEAVAEGGGGGAGGRGGMLWAPSLPARPARGASAAP